jgi:hypothetical protein
VYARPSMLRHPMHCLSQRASVPLQSVYSNLMGTLKPVSIGGHEYLSAHSYLMTTVVCNSASRDRKD